MEFTMRSEPYGEYGAGAGKKKMMYVIGLVIGAIILAGIGVGIYFGVKSGKVAETWNKITGGSGTTGAPTTTISATTQAPCACPALGQVNPGRPNNTQDIITIKQNVTRDECIGKCADSITHNEMVSEFGMDPNSPLYCVWQETNNCFYMKNCGGFTECGSAGFATTRGK